MDPIDSIKRRLDSLLPGNHRLLLLGLLGFLIIITHDNDYAGYSLEPRQAFSSTATVTEPPETSVSAIAVTESAKTEIQAIQIFQI